MLVQSELRAASNVAEVPVDYRYGERYHRRSTSTRPIGGVRSCPSLEATCNIEGSFRVMGVGRFRARGPAGNLVAVNLS